MGLGTADALAGALALLVPKGGLDGLREEVEILARLAGLTHTHQRTKATTARLQAQQQQLGERMRMLGELAPEVLHAVRNQLTVVIGFAGTIKDGALPAEGLREAGAEMEQAAQEASQLARQLGGLIRPRTEREQVLDLHAVIEAAAALLRQALGSRIEARLGLGAARSDVNATESRLLQVIIGLALRARDALPAGGIVEFRTSSAEPGGAAFEPPPGLSPNGCVRLRICARDRQLGNWAAASLSRADAPTRDELAAIRDMVEALGGVLAFDAEAGQGTVFEVFLPLVGPPAVASPRHEPDAPPKATGTVLVADDESSVRSVVRVMLSSADYRVLTAETGAQALETCASHADDIDVALVDLGLEDVDGLSCVAELRKQNPDLGTVLMSGRTLDDHQQEEMLAQGHVFLGKPFRKSTLVEAIERARQR